MNNQEISLSEYAPKTALPIENTITATPAFQIDPFEEVDTSHEFLGRAEERYQIKKDIKAGMSDEDLFEKYKDAQIFNPERRKAIERLEGATKEFDSARNTSAHIDTIIRVGNKIALNNRKQRDVSSIAPVPVPISEQDRIEVLTAASNLIGFAPQDANDLNRFWSKDGVMGKDWEESIEWITQTLAPKAQAFKAFKEFDDAEQWKKEEIAQKQGKTIGEVYLSLLNNVKDVREAFESLKGFNDNEKRAAAALLFQNKALGDTMMSAYTIEKVLGKLSKEEQTNVIGALRKTNVETYNGIMAKIAAGTADAIESTALGIENFFKIVAGDGVSQETASATLAVNDALARKFGEGKITTTIGKGVGQAVVMIPSLAAGAAGGGVAVAGTLAAQYFPGAMSDFYIEAKSEGASNRKALLGAIGAGALEVGTEYLGTVFFLGKGLLISKTAGKTAKAVRLLDDAIVGKNIGKWGAIKTAAKNNLKMISGESAEEVVNYVGNALLMANATGKDVEINGSEIADIVAQTAVATLTLGAGRVAASKMSAGSITTPTTTPEMLWRMTEADFDNNLMQAVLDSDMGVQMGADNETLIKQSEQGDMTNINLAEWQKLNEEEKTSVIEKDFYNGEKHTKKDIDRAKKILNFTSDYTAKASGRVASSGTSNISNNSEFSEISEISENSESSEISENSDFSHEPSFAEVKEKAPEFDISQDVSAAFTGELSPKNIKVYKILKAIADDNTLSSIEKLNVVQNYNSLALSRKVLQENNIELDDLSQEQLLERAFNMTATGISVGEKMSGNAKPSETPTIPQTDADALPNTEEYKTVKKILADASVQDALKTLRLQGATLNAEDIASEQPQGQLEQIVKNAAKYLSGTDAINYTRAAINAVSSANFDAKKGVPTDLNKTLAEVGARMFGNIEKYADLQKQMADTGTDFELKKAVNAFNKRKQEFGALKDYEIELTDKIGGYAKIDPAKKKIHINTNKELRGESFTKTLGHELTHIAAKFVGWKELKRVLLGDKLFKNFLFGYENYRRAERGQAPIVSYEEFFNDIKNRYETQLGKNFSDKYIEEEIAADVMGATIFSNNVEILQTLHNENKSLFKKILDWLKSLVSSTRGLKICDEAVNAVNLFNNILKDAKTAEIKQKGKAEFTIITPNNGKPIEIKGEYRVIDANDIKFVDITKKDEQNKQDRDRHGKNTRLQTEGILKNFYPARLMASATTAEGATLVQELDDGSVMSISGEGRARTLQTMYDQGGKNEQKYRETLNEFLSDYGMSVPAGIEKPMLVRVVKQTSNGNDFAAIAQNSNDAAQLERNDGEKAQNDSLKIDAALIESVPAKLDSGDVANVKLNGRFINEFNSRINAGANYMKYNGEGYVEAFADRVNNAIVAKILNNRAATFKLFVDFSQSFRYQIQDLKENGIALLSMHYKNPDYSICPEIGKAVEAACAARELIFQKKHKGASFDSLIANFFSTDSFEQTKTDSDRIVFNKEIAQNLASLFKTRSHKFGKVINNYISKINADFGESGKDIDMFATPKTREDYLNEVIAKIEQDEEKNSLAPELEAIKQQAIANGTFMKAPNGKPTNLNEKQWLQVRTKAFKKWFGDWERLNDIKRFDNVLVELKSEDVAQTSKDFARSAINWIENNPQENAKTVIGEVAITRRSVKDDFSHSKYADKLATLPAVKTILENGVYLGNKNDKDGKPITNYYFAGTVKLDGNEKVVFIRVKKAKNSSARFYVHEVFTTEKRKKVNAFKTTASDKPIEGAPTFYENIIADFLISVNENDVSKVIDENGEPLVVYHGGAVFNKFSKEKSSQGVFWFSADKNYSDQYTQNFKNRGLNGETKNLFINLRNPANWAEYDNLTTEQLKNSKDGAFLEDGEEKLGFVFSPNQIKSATDNTGTFDGGNADIRYSLIGAPIYLKETAQRDLQRLEATIKRKDKELYNLRWDKDQGEKTQKKIATLEREIKNLETEREKLKNEIPKLYDSFGANEAMNTSSIGVPADLRILEDGIEYVIVEGRKLTREQAQRLTKYGKQTSEKLKELERAIELERKKILDFRKRASKEDVDSEEFKKYKKEVDDSYSKVDELREKIIKEKKTIKNRDDNAIKRKLAKYPKFVPAESTVYLRLENNYGLDYGSMTTEDAYSPKSEGARAVAEIESVRERVEADGIKYSIIAYHGGGFDFDKPLREFRGKGEGNAVYGAGFYTALSKDVAKKYAKLFAGKTINGVDKDVAISNFVREFLKNNDYETGSDDAITFAESILHKATGISINNPNWIFEEIERGAKEYAKRYRTTEERRGARIARKLKDKYAEHFLNANLKITSSVRVLHTVSLPDDDGFNYLSEEESITEEQWVAIEKELEKTYHLSMRLYGTDIPKDAPGGYIYDSIAEKIRLYENYKRNNISFRTAKTIVSDFLRRVGIIGIRYNGRQDGECVVVFDENDVEVVNVERWSLAREQIIEKIKNSPTIEIRGDEIKLGNNEKENVKAAREYFNKLRGEYFNLDSGNKIPLTTKSVKEVLHHETKDINHLQSIVAMPEIAQKSVYITSKHDENGNGSKYDYYICGLKIGENKFTVKMVVRTNADGSRYYDHRLTKMEKGELADLLGGIKSPLTNNEASPISKIKDKRLVSILQALSNDTNGDTRYSLADERKNARLAMYEQIEAHNKFYEDKANFELVGEKAKSVAWWMLKYGKDKLTSGAREEALKGVPADEFVAHDIERLGKLIATVAREMLGGNAKNATREDVVAACMEINKVRLYKRLGQIVAFDDADLVMQAHNAVKTREEANDLNIVPEKIEESEFEKLALDKRIDTLALKHDASDYEKAKRLERDRAFASKLAEKANEESDEEESDGAKKNPSKKEAQKPIGEEQAKKILETAPKIANEIVQVVLDKVFPGTTIKPNNLKLLMETATIDATRKAVFVKTLRSTAVRELSRLATQNVSAHRRSFVNEVLRELSVANDAEKMRKLLVRGIGLIAYNARKESRGNVYERIGDLLRTGGTRFKSNATDASRRLGGELEYFLKKSREVFFGENNTWVATLEKGKTIAEEAKARGLNINDIVKKENLTKSIGRMEEIEKLMESSGTDEADLHKLRELELEYRALAMFGGAATKSVAELQELEYELRKFIEQTIDEHTQKVELQKKEREEIYGAIADAAKMGKRVSVNQNSALKLVKELFKNCESFVQQLEAIIKYASGEKEDVAREQIKIIEAMMNEAATVREEMQAQRMEDLATAAKNAWGETWQQKIAQFNKIDKKLDYLSLDDNEMSLARLATLYAQVRQPHFSRPLSHKEDYDPADIAKIQKRVAMIPEMERALGVEGIRFVDELCAILEKNKGRLQTAFKNVTGWAFDTNEEYNGKEAYFPIYRKGQGMRLGIAGLSLSIVPVKLSARVESARDVREDLNILEAFNESAGSTEQFIAYHDLQGLFTQMFGDAKFIDAIEKYAGKPALNQLREHATHIISNKTLTDKDGTVEKMIAAASITALGGNLIVMLRQTTSIPAYIFNMSAASVAKHMVSWGTPEGFEAMKTIVNDSKWFKARFGRGFNGAFLKTLTTDSVWTQKKARALAWYMINNNLGDAVPVLFVGQGIYRETYKACLKQGFDEKTAKRKALMEVALQSEKSQQSGRIENASRAARSSGIVAKAMIQFQATSVQFLSYEVRAISDFMARPNDLKRIKKLAKVLALNHIVLPGLFSAMTMVWDIALGGDPEEWGEDWIQNFLIPMIIGPFNGLWFFGSSVIGLTKTQLGSTIPSANIVLNAKHGIKAVAKAVQGDNDEAIEELDKAVQSLIPIYRHTRDAIENYSD